MGKTIIEINGDKITINQVRETPTKENKTSIANKVYYIVMCDFDESSWVELITEEKKEAFFTKKELEKKADGWHEYRVLVQKQGSIFPCNGADWDID